MLGAGACDTASADFAAIGDVLTQGGNIFVVDICHFVAAEAAWLVLKLLIQCSSFR